VQTVLLPLCFTCRLSTDLQSITAISMTLSLFTSWTRILTLFFSRRHFYCGQDDTVHYEAVTNITKDCYCCLSFCRSLLRLCREKQCSGASSKAVTLRGRFRSVRQQSTTPSFQCRRDSTQRVVAQESTTSPLDASNHLKTP